MRIIAGEHRGRRIDSPDGMDTRPTTDRVRESVMSSISSMTGGFDGLNVADAFAGSGAMGLEALSRGAAHAMLNDTSNSAQAIIKKNVEALGYGPSAVSVRRTDVLKSGIPADSGKYDIVFLDPPYKVSFDEIMQLVSNAAADGLLSEDCIIVYEHSAGDEAPDVESHGLRLLSHKRYGKTEVEYICINQAKC